MANLFSVPMFFVIFREALEASVIVSVLLSFVSRMELKSLPSHATKKLKSILSRMIWIGTAVGLAVTIVLGGVIISVWYIYGQNIWEGAELLWEAIFGTIATIVITITALSMLKSHEMEEHLKQKLLKQLGQHGNSSSEDDDNDTVTDKDKDMDSIIEKAGTGASVIFFWVPCLTVLREGLETMVFIGGVAISEPPSAIPLAAIAGILCGSLIGIFMHYGGSKLALRMFFIISAYFLLVIAAGLASRSEGLFEDHAWSLKVSIDPDAQGSVFFDPRVNVWMLPCCGKSNGIWAVMYAIFGFRNVATIGTVTIYCLYWIAISIILVLMRLVKQKESRP